MISPFPANLQLISIHCEIGSVSTLVFLCWSVNNTQCHGNEFFLVSLSCYHELASFHPTCCRETKHWLKLRERKYCDHHGWPNILLFKLSIFLHVEVLFHRMLDIMIQSVLILKTDLFIKFSTRQLVICDNGILVGNVFWWIGTPQSPPGSNTFWY